MSKKFDNDDGVWRTIGGRRVFIRNGQDLASAMKESGKFKSAKKSEAKKEMTAQEASEAQLKRAEKEYKDVSELRDEYEDRVLSKADEEDILERYGEDYGYDGKDNLENLRGQIDYMRNPNESINQTAQRLVAGGDFLIYNGDIQDWLKERNIKYNDDNFFDVYKKEMANKIEKLYNQGGEKVEEKGISEKRIQSLAKMYDVDRKTAERNAYFPKDIQSVKKHGGAGSYDESEWSKPKTTNETMNNAIREKASKKTKNNDTIDKFDLTGNETTDFINEMKYNRGISRKNNMDESVEKDYVIDRLKDVNTSQAKSLISELKKKNEDRVDIGFIVDKMSEKNTTNNSMNNTIRNAYEEYKKKHPNSKMTFDRFKNK